MFRVIFSLILISVLASAALAQSDRLPRFKKGENYGSLRTRLIKAGWKPFHSPDADQCGEGDKRCKGRPEMESCAGTGLANCKFLWKGKTKTLAIFTVGEIAVYQGHEFQ